MDADRLNAKILFQNLTNSLESTAGHPLINQFKSTARKALSAIGSSWKEEFHQAKTDFQRVCYLLKAIESYTGKHKRGVDRLGLSTTREEMLGRNGKSDEISRRYFSYAKLAVRERDINTSLAATTKAVFYAMSPEQLARALTQRCKILHRNELYDEAVEDGLRVLKLPSSQSEIGNIHLILGHCYLEKNMLTESKSHYNQAATVISKGNKQSRLEAEKGLNLCISAENSNEGHQYEPRWKCFRAKAPDLTEIESQMASSIAGASKTDSLNAGDPKLLAVANNILRMKNTGSDKCGWTLELNADVSTGDVLIVEKPWAISVWIERTRYCYYCCKRCHNLKPCSNCPYVGFCSDECEKNSKEPVELPEDGNKHIYDCQGLCPAIIFDEHLQSIQTAYNCLAKVPPERLLDYIYSTGSYANDRGHQAFKGADEVRRVPPTVYDPSDYSSIAFLTTCSEQRQNGTLEYFTQAAVFLAFCFYLEGYPIKWFDETDIFFSDPSSSNRPEMVPASWIAACLLYHIQAMDVNYFGIRETVLDSRSEEFACAIYPTISLINHSCDPNVAISCADKGVAFVHALRPIRAGSEIFISYKYSFYFKSTEERRESLKEQYFFNCECEACSNDWSRGSITSPERLICQNCRKVFFENMKGCPFCKSPIAMMMLRQYREKVIPNLRRFALKDTCSLEELKYATNSADSILPYLHQPSTTYYEWKDFYADILSNVYGIRTIEPWAESDSSESSSL